MDKFKTPINLLEDIKKPCLENTFHGGSIKIMPPQSDLLRDEEYEEELKDNINYLEFMPNSRKASRITAKNPYSLLQQPIYKRFSHTLNVRDSLTPLINNIYGVKTEQQSSPSPRNRISDSNLGLKYEREINIFASPRNSGTYDNKKFEKDENFSIYEGKSRNSLLTNIDDFLKSFSIKNIINDDTKSQASKKSIYNNDDKVEASLNEYLLKDLNDQQNELEHGQRKMLYDYLVDFMVMSLEEQEVDAENNFLIDEDTEKLQKELNDIPGLYKKLKVTTGMKECAFLQVTKMNELEKIKIDYDLYPDNFPCLAMRKNLLLLTKYKN